MKSRLTKSVLGLGLAAALAAPLPSPASVLHAAALADAYWQENNTPGNCTWTSGTLFAGKTAYYNITQDPVGERKYRQVAKGDGLITGIGLRCALFPQNTFLTGRTPSVGPVGAREAIRWIRATLQVA